MSDQTSSGSVGVGMILAAYVDEEAADQTLDNMKKAKKQGSFYFDDAAVVRQDSKGKVKIKETGDMTTGHGAGIGALVGGVVGILGGAAGIALGAAAGAAIGGIAAHTDGGFDHDSLKELGGALVPGSSAIAATTSKEFVENVREAVPDTDTMSLARDLSSQIHDQLVARNDVLFGLVLTDQGVAATQIVSSPEMVAVFGVAADEQGTAVKAGVATADGTEVVDGYVPVDDGSAPQDDSSAPADDTSTASDDKDAAQS